MSKFSIGFSPCPNDTFIFDKMIHQSTDVTWDLHLEDVETLNQWALEGKLDITKLSFATYVQVQDKYELLHSGAALGYGVGPILVTKDPRVVEDFDKLKAYIRQAKVAIPGKNTTAALLLRAAFAEIGCVEEMIFSEIESAVLAEKVDAGLLIHENRFTYQDKGLHKLIDLGNWWEQQHNAPIPLGCIVICKELAHAWKSSIEAMIAESLQHSWDNYPQLSPFVVENAQEMDESVMRAHIELYVNEETKQLSAQALRAIDLLREVYQKA